MRFAYADPPYVGQAKRHYGDHSDYAGEVDHESLIRSMTMEYDGWALSCSMKSLQQLLAYCPPHVLVLSWVKPTSPPMGDKRIYSWEPVILHNGRKPRIPTRTSLVLSPPQFTFRERPPEHVIGEKPPGFCLWLFQSAGLLPTDDFFDLFSGSGAVAKAWGEFAGAPSFDMEPGGGEYVGGTN